MKLPVYLLNYSPCSFQSKIAMEREHHRLDTRHHKVVLPNPRYRNLVLPESEMQKVRIIYYTYPEAKANSL